MRLEEKKGRMKSYIKNWPGKFSDFLLSWMQMQGRLMQSSGSHRTESGCQGKAGNLSLNASSLLGGWGSLVPLWEPSVRHSWKGAMGNTSSAAAEGISLCRETYSCYWVCANPCPWCILTSVNWVVAQIREHWHLCYIKCRSSGTSRAWHVPGHRENKCLSGGTVTVSAELLLEIQHLSVGWRMKEDFGWM